MMLPAALFEVHLLSTQLVTLWHKMKSTVAKATTLVTNDLYLPAPAIFCPQPTADEQVCS